MRHSESFAEANKLLAEAVRLGLEGIVSKKRGSATAVARPAAIQPGGLYQLYPLR
jgi:hypothetical protein